MDVVIAAQSFHWFTNRAALEEFHRVLTPGGSFGMVWVLLDDMAAIWLKEIKNFLRILDENYNLFFLSCKSGEKCSLISHKAYLATQKNV